MTDNIDIVEYLRRNAAFNYRDTYIAAADEIERLRKELDTRIAMCDMRSEKIIELIAERDEVRLEICNRVSKTTWNPQFPLMSAKQYAEERGWDCFKENSNE
jgi:hypothetical protein